MDTEFVDRMKDRTKAFARDIVLFYRELPKSGEFQVVGRQMLRSATSVAANYRASCRARSRAEFIAKIGIAVEEADETVFWLELSEDLKFDNLKQIEILKDEGIEILKILASSRATAKRNSK